MSGPLSHLRVLDLSRVLAGPYATMMLADFGADVIKVEKTPDGDDSRRFAPVLECGESASFMIVNRNKRGIGVNLKTQGGREVLARLLKDADVVVRPSLGGLKSADFSARKQAIDSGRAAMLAALPALKARLDAAVMATH